jgi:hypothetical protein
MDAEPMTGESLSTMALELARQGWPVFPVSLSTKRPRCEHGHLDASTDERRIRGWEREFNVGGGIATPTGKGLLVIDIDPRNGGSRPAWCPDTLTAGTQSGGIHLYYKVEPDDIKSRAGLFGIGVDSKSGGGYVLMPPTPGYRWLDMRPRAVLTTEDVRSRFVESYQIGGGGATFRLPPEEWARGIIHEQVVTWAAYFAGQLDHDDVPTAVWAMVDQARASGVPIDNARNHIGTAIRWVLDREANSQGSAEAPSLA